ncbi:MAG: chemotaxis protein CheB [Oligoflexia bacterium]|nr:chemotaxis protein CheB [Oligoflexia bacterium]
MANGKKSKQLTSTEKIHSRQDIGGFPIVGVGASAGGLEAFTKFLTTLPTDTGMAFVLLQHLDPNHASMSSEILSRVSKMPITEVTDGMRAEPNHVYVIPPGFSMGIFHGVLNLVPRTEVRGQHLVIDYFFHALAEDQKNLAIGIVLSGTGADGTQGLTAIKAEGGITFAQTPQSAKFDNMPQSAIESGSVDLILTPEQIAQELARIAHHPYVILASSADPIAMPDDQPLDPHDGFRHIFHLLRKQCHVDFAFYKSTTVKRRIERRMVLHKMESLEAYNKFLSHNLDEVKALYADILIHVTNFFRDPDAFKALKTEVFPKLMQNRGAGVPLRVWVPGCSTGEEAYSIAMSLLEFLGEKSSHTPIQIFASDISEQAIQKARLGKYPHSISSDVSRERLNRFFIQVEGGGYKIAKSIRDICVFSRLDLTTDSPFAKIDLISCRNLLIYFTTTLQKHVIPIFHYSLLARGFLWLGKSETIGGFSDLFSQVDKTNKIYARKDAPIALSLRFPSGTYVRRNETVLTPKSFTKVPRDVQKIADQMIQADCPGVLVSEDMEILQLRGRTSPFIEPAPGVPSHHLFKMAHPDLIRVIRMTIQAAKKSGQSVRKEGLRIGDGRSGKSFDLNVIPDIKEHLYLILFERAAESKEKKKKALAQKGRKGGVKKDPYNLELQQELTAAQEYQQSLIEKFETAQEDLTSANEELQSANEELQTAKEELQSGNEELTTVNDELQTRSSDQSETNNDLINLLGSVEIPIVMLGADRRVRRFTPLAGKALNLIATDVGRPLSDLKLNFTAPGGELDLEMMVSDAIDSMKSQELEIQDRKGHWFRLQVRPYKTVDNKIDGAVLALVDIDSLKLSLKEVKEARTEAEKANRSKDLFLATLSHELRTPLTAILSWAQLIRTGKLDPEKIKRAAEVIEVSGKSQAQLINDLLDVSRIVAGKLSLDIREIDTASVVLSAIVAVRPMAEAKSIQLDTFFAPQVGTIMADPIRLQQVFWNLLSNAVKFSAPDSKVSVRVDRFKEKNGEKAKAMIQVVDSGKGIDAEFLPKIFDRFSQEDSSSIRVHGGLGLGLAIVQNLVELHDGTIRAESPGDQLGATFTVILPIKSEHSLSEPQANHRDPLKSSKSGESVPVRLDGLRLLIVDDEANAREAFSEVLYAVGAEVKTAGSAREGLNMFAQFKPDVLLCDIAMPGEDGYSFIQKIRRLGQGSRGNTPALAVTAYAGEDDVRRALSAGFQAHLAKPVDGEHLVKTIAKLARKDT